MTGSHDYLTEQSSTILDETLRDDYKLLCSAVLNNQYLTSTALPNKQFKCISGTGMGMTPSGSISDAVLHSTMEKNFFLKVSTRRRYGIVFYARFKDDILVIVQSPFDEVIKLIDEMRVHATPFKLVVDSVSKSNCQMLDLDIRLVSRGDFLSCSFGLCKNHLAFGFPYHQRVHITMRCTDIGLYRRP